MNYNLTIKRHNKPILLLLIFCFILITTSVTVYADTRYVSDKLIITMREGTGNEYKIVKMLKTGTPVEVIEESGQYYRIQTEDGKEGWALKQYITAETPKTIIISRLKQEIKTLKNDIEKLDRQRDTLKKDLTSAEGIHKDNVKQLEKGMKEKNDQIYSITTELQKMTNDYNRLAEASSNVAKIVNERDMLNEENRRLSTENNDLLQENARLSGKKAIYWFLAGGVVFFFGWMAGKSVRKKKRYSSLGGI